ncbi:MAG TPA: MBL fold metallo-hydrolase [Blastocatellia bacterium]|nr:MBL fold metallo-hydrolase [Blastocatellia bacterium]
MELTFLGATGTVTGSKYLVEAGGARVLVDCGLFQGYKQLRLRNWSPLPITPADIDAVVLTHAHIDHTGYVPLLVKRGFKGPVYCSPATRELCGILLPDAGYLQEEEARYMNRHKVSKHEPAEPLYTRDDAERSLKQLEPVPFETDKTIAGGMRMRLKPAGHILGAGHLLLSHDEGGRNITVAFSGDVGRPNDPIMPPPSRIERADYLVVESTYGNRTHDPEDPQAVLGDIIRRTADRHGVILIPAFAVGRAQTILLYVLRLKKAGAIPDIPVYLDSPMAIKATGLLTRHCGEHRLSADECDALSSVATYVDSVEASKRVSASSGPMIVISASGMATGGRVLHHLKAFVPDARNTILFVGFQAGGTRGGDMVRGADAIKIHGEYFPIRAEVRSINTLSAHADAAEIIDWLRGFATPPRETFITHGEQDGAEGLRRQIREKLGWNCTVPDYKDRVRLV